jgi:hypothetical protein
VALTHVEQIIELLPNAGARSAILNLLLFLPTFSFAVGRWDAYLIKAGASEQYVDIARSRLPLDSDSKNQVAYLGFLGNVYVLREAKTGDIVLVRQRDDSPIFLAPKQK